MSSHLTLLDAAETYEELCHIDGCDRLARAGTELLVTGLDVDNEEHNVELALCRPHADAFELVREGFR